MLKFKIGKTKKGEKMHFAVGAVIEKDGKYLLIDRKLRPFGFAGLAGHIDEGEQPAETLLREVKEESGLKVLKFDLLFEEELKNNTCVTGVSTHYWYVYKCQVTGQVKQNKKEEKSIGWYTKEEIKKLTLEPAWQYWFRKARVI